MELTYNQTSELASELGPLVEFDIEQVFELDIDPEFLLCPQKTLANTLSDRRKERLVFKLATTYQELTDVALRSIAVMSALNSCEDGCINKADLIRCAKFGSNKLASIRYMTTEHDFISEKYFTKENFLKLIRHSESAASCLKVHCAFERGQDELSGDQVTRLKVRWADLISEIINCIHHIRSIGVALHGPSDRPLSSSIESWLNEVQSGGSYLDDPAGPLCEFSDLSPESTANYLFGSSLIA